MNLSESELSMGNPGGVGMCKKTRVSLFTVLAVMFLTSCSQLERRRSSKGVRGVIDSQQGVTFDQSNQGEELPAEELEAKEPLPPPKVGLILGPGGINTFAHLGVIKELSESKVPIDMIVGIEWGALVGALYASTGQIHKAQWEIYKLKDSDLPQKSMFSKKLTAQKVHQVLKKFSFKNIKANVQFSCPSQLIYSGSLKWQKGHSLYDNTKRCMAFPPALESEGGWVAQPFSLKQSIDYLRSRGAQIIIISNVLGNSDILDRSVVKENVSAAVMWNQVRNTYNEFLQPENLKALGYKDVFVVHSSSIKGQIYDFSKRKTMALKGQRAARPVVAAIIEQFGF